MTLSYVQHDALNLGLLPLGESRQHSASALPPESPRLRGLGQPVLRRRGEPQICEVPVAADGSIIAAPVLGLSTR